MSKPFFRRIMARSARAGRHSQGFLGPVMKPRQFASEKAAQMVRLATALKLHSNHRFAIAAVSRNSIVKINRLSFAFTSGSNRACYFAGTSSRRIEGALPSGMARFGYVAPFIVVELNGSNRALQFWRKLAKLVERYPKAALDSPVPMNRFIIMSSAGSNGFRELIPADSLKAKQAEARHFFQAVEKIVDEFL